MEIYLNGLGFFQKFRVDDELETVNVKRLVRIGKLIQSHSQAGAPSAAFIEENPDRFDILSFEIFGNLLNCRLCDLKHNTLLGNKKIGPDIFRTGNPQEASGVESNHVHQVCQSKLPRVSTRVMIAPSPSLSGREGFPRHPLVKSSRQRAAYPDRRDR